MRDGYPEQAAEVTDVLERMALKTKCSGSSGDAGEVTNGKVIVDCGRTADMARSRNLINISADGRQQQDRRLRGEGLILLDAQACDDASGRGAAHSLADDVVLNGTELGSGSIRIHRQDIQSIFFNALGMLPEAATALRVLPRGAAIRPPTEASPSASTAS